MAFPSIKAVAGKVKAEVKTIVEMPKTAYVAITDFWHNKVYVPAESVIELTAAEVKYLKHAVTEVKADAKAVEATVAKPVEAVKAAVEAVKPAAKEDVKPDAKA